MQEKPIAIALVEDHARTREYLAALINGTPGLRCTDQYPSGERALVGIPSRPPDVALVDIHLPGIDGVECTSRLKSLLPGLRVVMLTAYEQSDLIFNSLRAGAAGYLLKNLPPEELIEALQQVHAGGAPMSMQVARKVVEHFHRQGTPRPSGMSQLTDRENDILALLAQGLLYKEIGQRLGISLSTVRTHVTRIYEKLHVQTRTEATIRFMNRS